MITIKDFSDRWQILIVVAKQYLGQTASYYNTRIVGCKIIAIFLIFSLLKNQVFYVYHHIFRSTNLQNFL